MAGLAQSWFALSSPGSSFTCSRLQKHILGMLIVFIDSLYDGSRNLELDERERGVGGHETGENIRERQKT